VTLRFAFLAVVLAVSAVGATPGSGTSGRSPVDELTLEQQVGQLLVLRFKGTVVPEYVLEALRRRRVAGVILFRDNIAGPAQLRALTRSLRATGGAPLVAVDQEGGDIRILRWAPPFASQPAQAAAGTVRRDAEAGARALRSLGITISLAPVADVPSGSRTALATRAFSGDPKRAGRAVIAAVNGWRAGGVAPTVKHFPGLGDAGRNTDGARVTINLTRAELETDHLPPFAAAVRAGVPIVMVGHARYPALDRAHIASQSRAIVEDLLRVELGFGGVVMTDSMEAKASLATGGIRAVSERAVRAGADVVLLTGRGSYEPVFRQLLAVARGSEAFRARVRESAARVLALKRT
jgi:beta-N-acetylhexosaminidase